MRSLQTFTNHISLQDAIYNATLASLQRTYTVCSIDIEIGIINGTEGFPFVDGGDYPLMVFLPNLNIEVCFPSFFSRFQFFFVLT